ncbi:MAG TPA: class I SAM-dependent methyltransferase [Vicinamibacterales bacterium]|nr:class I SAM-dependent methyltransferase [Vicinamibacterales bacterium]
MNLLHGEGFHDDADPERSASEELMDAYTTTHYTIPALARNAHDTGRSALRVLSVGCGVGAGVDLINDAGHECYGIDCGSRVLDWSRRRNLARMYIANAKHLPFADGTFDVAFSGCVLAHIGVVGDTWETTPACAEERLQFCREIARVVRPGGSILLSGANRACPADLFHRDHGYWPRLHGPKEPFLIAFADYEHYFVEQCGCRSVTALSSEGYWGFNKLTRSAAGRLLAAVISMHMTIVSRVRPLRTSFLNPWLIVRVEK